VPTRRTEHPGFVLAKRCDGWTPTEVRMVAPVVQHRRATEVRTDGGVRSSWALRGPGYVVLSVAQMVPRVGRSGPAACQTPRARSLTPRQEAEVRALAATRSLRSLAADFGASHETVRAALRRARSGQAVPPAAPFARTGLSRDPVGSGA
jgi:hypothetical protein